MQSSWNSVPQTEPLGRLVFLCFWKCRHRVITCSHSFIVLMPCRYHNLDDICRSSPTILRKQYCCVAARTKLCTVCMKWYMTPWQRTQKTRLNRRHQNVLMQDNCKAWSWCHFGQFPHHHVVRHDLGVLIAMAIALVLRQSTTARVFFASKEKWLAFHVWSRHLSTHNLLQPPVW